jgi:hypothetical protein
MALAFDPGAANHLLVGFGGGSVWRLDTRAP